MDDRLALADVERPMSSEVGPHKKRESLRSPSGSSVSLRSSNQGKPLLTNKGAGGGGAKAKGGGGGGGMPKLNLGRNMAAMNTPSSDAK